MLASGGSKRRRLGRVFGGGAILCPLAVGASFGWWLTSEPAPDPSRGTVSAAPTSLASAPTHAEPGAQPDVVPTSSAHAPITAWPEARLEGQAAKEFLLRFTRDAAEQLARVPGYTATMRRRERIGGKLGPDQTLKLKVRHEPFSVYLRFEAPKAGKEAIYAEGQNDGHVVAHNGDWTRKLVPRLKVAPTSTIAMIDNRHPITDAGLANLTNKLLRFRELDLEDPHATTILDRSVADDGSVRYRSLHLHDFNDGVRPFAKVEVFYCPERRIPIEISSYEWPDPSADSADLVLGEHYKYDDLDFDAELTALDFDPSNPAYEFHR